MSWTALEIGRRLGFREGGVEEMEVVCKWWPKWSSPNPRLLGEFIGEGSTKLEGNSGIKSKHSLQIFSDKGHTALMQANTGRTALMQAHTGVRALLMRQMTPAGPVVLQLAWRLILGPDSSTFRLDISEMFSKPKQNRGWKYMRLGVLILFLGTNRGENMYINAWYQTTNYILNDILI
jgi:hypothetical protein